MREVRQKKQCPNKEELLELLELLQSGELEKAEQCARNLVEIYPRNSVCWKILGVAIKKSGRSEEAIDYFKKSVVLDPDDAEAHNNLGVSYSSLGKIEEASKCYQNAINKNPRYAEAYNNLANAQQKNGQFMNAKINCLNAIKLKPKYAEAHCNLSSILLSLKEYEEAKASVTKALEINPNYPEAYNNLGNICYSMRELSQAEKYYRKALLLNDQFYEAYNNLGSTLQNQGRLNESHETLQKAIQLNPSYSDAILNLALNYFFADKIEQAIATFKHLISIDLNNNGIKALINLAIINYLLGNDLKTLDYLDKSRNVLKKTDKQYKYYAIYWSYLSKLLKNIHNKKEIFYTHHNIIYVVGESHSLGSHNLKLKIHNKNYICKTYWIPGCKQWHLGNLQRNIFKFKFEEIVKKIPDNSIVVLAIGEIDCRENDGIIYHLSKNTEKKLIDVIDTTITSYFNYITKIVAIKNKQIIVQGVPAPKRERLENLSAELSNKLCDLIFDFNRVLKEKSIEYGFSFLDLYSTTMDCKLSSSGNYHIDEYHLNSQGILNSWLHGFYPSPEIIEHIKS